MIGVFKYGLDFQVYYFENYGDFEIESIDFNGNYLIALGVSTSTDQTSILVYDAKKINSFQKFPWEIKINLYSSVRDLRKFRTVLDDSKICLLYTNGVDTILVADGTNVKVYEIKTMDFMIQNIKYDQIREVYLAFNTFQGEEVIWPMTDLFLHKDSVSWKLFYVIIASILTALFFLICKCIFGKSENLKEFDVNFNDGLIEETGKKKNVEVELTEIKQENNK